MGGHTCYHCKQWVGEGEAHDCWTTTEAALTADLGEDLREAWERLRETAVEFGDQRIYASHSSIMFSRRACYFFVRPKRRYLEVVVFLGREIRAPQIHKVIASSKVKRAHVIRIEHRDQVEAPVTDWLREAYAFVEVPRARPDAGSGDAPKATRAATAPTARQPKAKAKVKAPARARATGSARVTAGAEATGKARATSRSRAAARPKRAPKRAPGSPRRSRR